MYNNSVWLTELEVEYRRQEAFRQAEMDHLARLAKSSSVTVRRLSLVDVLLRLFGRPARPVLVPKRVQRPENVRRRQPQQQCC